ncbi:MAG: GTP-binding protein TypA [Gammaproteobacteria bacterium RIFCSPLOWO2_02_FULL_42_9]|nr:MAG: GTP-binding protein TypA [Gammaproteobacteria bacterium RIFCSPLOWO2_02_FULL_42_9]
MKNKLRNIAIIAHVDHGKTTLVDKLLQQSGTFHQRMQMSERILDSNDLEKERGITILAKNIAIEWNGYHINIVDTPGHADFGGEVERILSMVDSVLLLVDAVDGPMPQTRFVTQKAFAQGLNPILVVNKVDRPGSRPDWVVDQVFDLFDKLGATDKQLDFPIIYTSALLGYATLDLNQPSTDMKPLFEMIVDHVPPPLVNVDAPFQMQISSLDYSSYVGSIGIGRIKNGMAKTNMLVTVVSGDGEAKKGRILQVLKHVGLEREEVPEAYAGDIIAITGIDDLKISDTLCDPDHVKALPALLVDEPTVVMTFQVNTSPFAGREGKFLTSRHLRDRLQRELIHNVALRVEETSDPDKFRVSGRGELHLSILLENMRREGYELAVSRPEVITKMVDGKECEPYELVIIDIEERHQGVIMEQMGMRQAKMQDMQSDGKGRIRLDYIVPTRKLIGFHTGFLTMTSGTGIIHHIFDHFGMIENDGDEHKRQNGVLISNCAGKATGFSIWNMQERGKIFIDPQTEVYEGMIIGLHSRDNDLVVNIIKGKQLTNIRSVSSDEHIVLVPPIKMTLEQALDFIDDDELVEITPKHIRLRKKFLTEIDRKRAGRE